MPIKRLMQQTAAFPRIGKLRKGATKPNDKQPGKDLEHFRFDSDDPYAVERFEAAYGKEPRQINIYLPYETVEENFQTWQESYVAGGLKHRCDGETCVIWQKPDGTYSQEPTPCPGGCKEVGRLSVIIPELARLAYVTVETHSINDILHLTNNLQAALALRGSLAGIPFVLSRRPQEISTPGKDGKRARYTKYMLFLEPHPDWVRVQLATMRHNALTIAAGVMALPEHRQLTAGQIIDMGTGEIIEPTIMNGNGKQALTDDVDLWQKPEQVAEEPADKPEPGQITEAQMKTLHSLGMALYGNKTTWDSKRPAMCAKASKERTSSSKQLWQAEANQLIRVLEDKIRTAYEEIATSMLEAGKMNIEQTVDIDNLYSVELARTLTSLQAMNVQAAIPA
jgi:hypothetical protein